jgi:hypothetical protein
MRRLLLGLPLVAALNGCGGQADVGTAGTQPSPTTLAEQCLGAVQNLEETDEYEGMPEAEALERARAGSEGGGRVVARNNECVGTSRDLRHGRVNFVVEDGAVAWAAVERLPS